MALVVKEKRSDESKDCDEKCNDQRDFCTKRKRLRFRCSSEILVLLVETSVDSHLMRVVERGGRSVCCCCCCFIRFTGSCGSGFPSSKSFIPLSAL